MGSRNKPRANSETGMQGDASVGNNPCTVAAHEDELKKLREQNAAMQMEINSLRNKTAYYETILKGIKAQVSKAVD